MRLFLGMPWPEASAADLALRARVWEGRPALRPVRPENWHVTLRFLGETPEDQVPALVQLLEAWAHKRGPLTFVDRGWGCFGSYENPRVVTLALEALPEVRRVIEAFHKTLDTAGFPGDGKAWKPHLTLAYGRGGHPGPWPEAQPGGRPPVVFPRAVLYESELGPGGSVYRQLATVKFGGPGSVPD